MKPFVAHVKSPIGSWGVEGTERGITRVSMPAETRPSSRGVAPEAVARGAAQLEQYFRGTRRTFDVTLFESPATSFQRDVWSALCDIPFGEVKTYGDVARATNRPRAMRAVGNANHANPWPIIVPCHRVVSARVLGGYGGGERVKRFLLDLEGVHYP
jgi:methylated-DNA-[protein]-cysteine S-methyltransferase